MKFLFVQHSLNWPRASGHDVHSYGMMRALVHLGHDVALLTQQPATEQAVTGISLSSNATFADIDANDEPMLRGLQERFRNYWGISNSNIRRVAACVKSQHADVVVAVGLEVLPLLAEIQSAQRVWYAADEWVWHHLSVVRVMQRSTWSHLRSAAIKGLYERTFRNVIDRAWVVSTADQRAMNWLAGIKPVDVIPNGVDTDFYRPGKTCDEKHSCVFWGRLDFEPNVQAIEWFVKHVWPDLYRKYPTAQLRLFGFSPTAEVKAMAGINGIILRENLPDLRDEIDRCQVVVLPFQSGGGVKNKLLEAASMAKSIVCSKRACNGLVLPTVLPFIVANRPADWMHHIECLWNDPAKRQAQGDAARDWVTNAHSWEASAAKAAAPLMANRVSCDALSTVH